MIYDWKNNMIWLAGLLAIYWFISGTMPGFLVIALASLATLGIRWMLKEYHVTGFKARIDDEFEEIRRRREK